MTKKTVIDEEEKFIVEITEEDSDAAVITSSKEFSQKLLKRAMASYAGNERTYSQGLSEKEFMKTTLTEDKLESLAYRAQENLTKIQEINSYIDFYLNHNDIVGRTFEIIEANVNSFYQLSYPVVEGRNKEKALDRTKKFIEEFNKQIELKDLIIETIPYAYSNGNKVLYLRETDYGTYQVDKYPLGIAQISNFKVNNEPLVYFSIPDMLSRMTGIDIYNPMYGGTLNTMDLSMFPDMTDQVKQTFPEEVFLAYVRGKETAVKLDTDKTGVIRVNNRGKKYGLSPIFKALSPALKLEVQEKADSSDAKARGKKIIFQKISDKLMGEDGSDVDLSLPIYSHGELISALKNEVAVYTGQPWVESVTYVEPKIDNTVVDNLNYYKGKVLSALGIGFLDTSNKTGMVVSELNFTELMRVIDKISKQLESNVNKWYKYAMNKAGLPLEYAPTITILDSELMEMNLRMQLADKLFNSFGASYKTAFELLGVDYHDEIAKREEENEKQMDLNTFYPRMTNYTFSKANDKDYNENDKRTDNKDITKTNKTTKEQVEDVVDNGGAS